MTKFWLSVLVLLLTTSLQSFAEANAKKIEVNGFTVYLVDTQKGNQLGYVFAVPYGSADDEPAQFGRAHFFEHMYSRGSTKYPGHDTLIAAMTKFGFRRNAATGFSYTFYHGVGLEEHGPDALTMHLAPLWGVELEQSSIDREKATVINEIETSAPNRPGRAIYSLPFMALPEVGHPSRGHHVGTTETLGPMQADSLRELSNRIYHAGNVKLVVMGNFTSGKWKEDKIIETLKSALPAIDHKKAAYVPENHPTVFQANKVADIKLESERAAMIFVPIDPSADIRDVRAFASIYNAKARNSILEVGQRELGWLSDLSFSDIRIGNQRFLAIGADLTEAGYARREEAAQWLLDAVKAAGEANVPEQLLKQKADQNLEAGRRTEESVDAMMGKYGTWLGSEGYENELMLDWKGANAKLTNESVRKGAKAIRFENMAFTFIGPVILNGTIMNDPVYKRKYTVHDWQKPALNVPAYDPLRLAVPEVTLPAVATSEKVFSAKAFEKNGAWTYISQTNKMWSDRTVTLRIEMRKLSPLEAMGAGAWVFALNKKLAPEFAVLQSRGVSLAIGYESGNIVIKAIGQKGQEFAAIEWALKQLNDYVPQAIDVNNYRDSVKLAVLKGDEGFPGQVVMQAAKDLLAPKDTSLLQASGEANNLSVKTVEDIRAIIATADKTLAVAGEYSDSELKQLKAAAETISPKALNKAVPAGYQVKQDAEVKEPWQVDYVKGVGVARVMAGPGSNEINEQAAIRIVTTLLHEKVFLRNRPYGYVQLSTRLVYAQNQQQIAFFGQAESEDLIPKLEQVWDEEINRWLNDEVSLEDIEKGRTGIKAQLSRANETSNEAVEEVLSLMDYAGNPFRKDEVLKAVGEVKPEFIREVAKKYLNKKQPRLKLVKGVGTFSNCEDLVNARLAWRKANTPD